MLSAHSHSRSFFFTWKWGIEAPCPGLGPRAPLSLNRFTSCRKTEEVKNFRATCTDSTSVAAPPVPKQTTRAGRAGQKLFPGLMPEIFSYPPTTLWSQLTEHIYVSTCSPHELHVKRHARSVKKSNTNSHPEFWFCFTKQNS